MPQFLDCEQHPIEAADVILASLPFEKTVSYVTGTAKGPQAVLDASEQLEEFEEELGWEPTNDLKWHVLAPFECGADETASDYIKRIDAELKKIPEDKFVVGLGGEHSVTAPLARRCLKPGDWVINIDAHPDLRDEYLGERCSHASVMKRLFDDGMRICELGLQCISKDEKRFADSQSAIVHHWMHDLQTSDGFNEMLASLRQLHGDAYLTIDADGLSPGIMPGVGTPMPGGFTWSQLMRILRTLFSNASLSIVSCDVVEVRPLPGNPLSEFTAAKLVQKLVSYQWRLPRKSS